MTDFDAVLAEMRETANAYPAGVRMDLRLFADRLAAAHAAELGAAEARAEAAEQDTRRWRTVRKTLLWRPNYDGTVRWSMDVEMPDPPIATLTHESVAQCLDTAIDAAMAAQDGEAR